MSLLLGLVVRILGGSGTSLGIPQEDFQMGQASKQWITGSVRRADNNGSLAVEAVEGPLRTAILLKLVDVVRTTGIFRSQLSLLPCRLENLRTQFPMLFVAKAFHASSRRPLDCAAPRQTQVLP